jgi:ubiquinone/menaquinone biosynthesis C-methylase UbiE
MQDKTSQPTPPPPVQPEIYAPDYDSAFTHKLHVRRTAQNEARWFLLYLQPGMSLLDCGCATGSITVGLAAVVAPGQVIGVDRFAEEIERARARAASAAVTNLRFEVSNAYELAFPDNHFDAIFCHNVLEHIGEPLRALREMHRVLKVGGVIGVRELDMGGILVAALDERLKRFFAVFEADYAGVGGHPRLGRELRGLVNAAGFTVLTASASYDYFSTEEQLQLVSQIGSSRVKEAAFVERVLACRLTTAEELAAMYDAWLAWPTRPDAFLANSHGEVVGRKE